MHVVIITDLEGISCVDTIDMIPYDSEGYKKACEHLMLDLNAAVDGAFQGGATKVTVVDGHGGGKNFIMDMLDERATYLPVRDFIDKPIRDFDFNALMCVGAHAMAGTVNGFLDHTENSVQWFECCINGVPCGEMLPQAYTLGILDAPFIMVSGDEAVCNEAKELVSNVACAVVKKAKCRNKAECLPLEESLELIRNAAKDGVMRCGEIAPLKLTLPAELKITFTRNDYCDNYVNPSHTRNGRTLTRMMEKVERYGDFY